MTGVRTKACNSGDFKPGNSTRFVAGNPGRRFGSRNKTTVMVENFMKDDAAEIVRSVIDAAKAGDMSAARIILDRISPPRKGRAIMFELPDVAAIGLAATLTALARSMAVGEISPEEAKDCASVLESARRAVETELIEARLKALEARAGIPPALPPKEDIWPT
jgi:hypothetical protein